MTNLSNFFGSTTIGKKGQIVVPMETRKAMGWKEGEKLLVFGLKNDTVVLAKLSHAKELIDQFEKKMKKIDQIIKKSI